MFLFYNDILGRLLLGYMFVGALRDGGFWRRRKGKVEKEGIDTVQKPHQTHSRFRAVLPSRDAILGATLPLPPGGGGRAGTIFPLSLQRKVRILACLIVFSSNLRSGPLCKSSLGSGSGDRFPLVSQPWPRFHLLFLSFVPVSHISRG